MHGDYPTVEQRSSTHIKALNFLTVNSKKPEKHGTYQHTHKKRSKTTSFTSRQANPKIQGAQKTQKKKKRTNKPTFGDGALDFARWGPPPPRRGRRSPHSSRRPPPPRTAGRGRAWRGRRGSTGRLWRRCRRRRPPAPAPPSPARIGSWPSPWKKTRRQATKRECGSYPAKGYSFIDTPRAYRRIGYALALGGRAVELPASPHTNNDDSMYIL